MIKLSAYSILIPLFLTLSLIATPGSGHTESNQPANKAFTVVNIETPQGVKIWQPPSLIVNKGDMVKIKLVNKLDLEHGYRIADYKVEKVVQGQQTETIEFTADKVGIFLIDCQLHPAHVQGQLVVLP